MNESRHFTKSSPYARLIHFYVPSKAPFNLLFAAGTEGGDHHKRKRAEQEYVQGLARAVLHEWQLSPPPPKRRNGLKDFLQRNWPLVVLGISLLLIYW